MDQQPTQLERELAWKIKRSKRITSSCISKLNKGGKGADKIFGLTAIAYINQIITQIKESDLMDETERGVIWQMQFGRDHEEEAIHWIRENFMDEDKSGTTDFDDILLLTRSLTHRSYLNEHPDALEDNERLEFLGDAVLDFLVGEWLYNRFPEMEEGDLTQMRSAFVQTNQLAEFAKKIRLEKLQTNS